MFDAKTVIIWLVLIGTISGGTARAENTLHQDFADHFFKACLPFVLSGRSPEDYLRSAVSRESVRVPAAVPGGSDYERTVTARKLVPADSALAPDLLHGRAGQAYVQLDPNTPMSLTLSDNGLCSVAANNMPDIDQLVVTTERRLETFSPPFSKKGENAIHADDDSVITSREYTAEINGHKFLAIFATAPIPGLDQVGEAVVTVSKTLD
jgi:hypothetical protein